MSGDVNRLLLCFLVLSAAGPVALARLQMAWPTPNTAYVEGRPIEEYVQPTASGEPTSGLLGCVRSGGNQFHEGLDLKSIAARDHGELTDDIYATMDGKG